MLSPCGKKVLSRWLQNKKKTAPCRGRTDDLLLTREMPQPLGQEGDLKGIHYILLMDSPINCVSFSPNWFYPQIVQITPTLIAYGANDKVFVYNWLTKAFQYQLQAAGKVTLLYFHLDLLFVGAEGGVISIFQGSKYISKIELNVQVPYFLQFLHGEYVVFDEKGIGLAFELSNYQLLQFRLKLITQPRCLPKLAGDLVVYQNGRIYDTHSQKHIEYGCKILCADQLQDSFAILAKFEKKLSLHVFTKAELWNWASSTKEEQAKPLVEVKFSINEKLPFDNLKKAPVSIRFVTQERIMISSKQGDLYIINLPHLAQRGSELLKLDPKSLEEGPYYKIPIELHFQGVFLIGRQVDTFFTVGVDRRIQLFTINGEDVQPHWRIISLSSKASNFARGCEKNLIFFQDQSLKALDLSKKNDPCYINQFWKYHSFDGFYLSPFSEGLVVFQKGEKLELVNIYAEQIHGKFECDQPFCKLIWIENKEYAQLMKLAEQSGIVSNSEAKLVFKPTEHHQYLIVLMLTGDFKLISLKSGQVVFSEFVQNLLAIKREIASEEFVTIKMSSVNFIYLAQTLYVTCVYNNNSLYFINSKQESSYKQLHTQQINHTDCQIVSNEIILASGSQNRTIAITKISSRITLLGYVKHQFPIERVAINNKYLLAIAKQHSSLQIWNLQPILIKLVPQSETLNLEHANIRGHSGYLLDAVMYNEDTVITSAEDQTIKTFSVSQVPNKHPPNKKKVKNKKVKAE